MWIGNVRIRKVFRKKTSVSKVWNSGEMREGITLWIDYVRMCFRNWLYHVDGIFLKEMEKYVEIFVEIDFLQVFSYTNFYAPFKVYGHVYSYY